MEFETEQEARAAHDQIQYAKKQGGLNLVEGIDWQPAASDVKNGVIGGIAELLVCGDLLLKGFDVYRSLTINGECDVIALKDGLMCRIEVKSARIVQGRPRFSEHKLVAKNFDVLALAYLREQKIEYRPDVTEWFNVSNSERLTTIGRRKTGNR